MFYSNRKNEILSKVVKKPPLKYDVYQEIKFKWEISGCFRFILAVLSTRFYMH